jgi:quercetin dioxygenase-like cupin family protein
MMNNREIVKTDNVLVREMVLEKDASTEWHHHSEVSDYFVCLTGRVRMETQNPDQTFWMHPGETAEVKPPQVHRVINVHDDRSVYLLVQGIGKYDFIKK